MEKTMKVKAKDPTNRPVFMEGKPRVLDADGKDTTLIRGEAVEVPDTMYYRRQIACGDLVVVPADAPAPSAKAGG
jgi:hypothetical protein